MLSFLMAQVEMRLLQKKLLHVKPLTVRARTLILAKPHNPISLFPVKSL
jgi:hypothetical protein